MAASELEKMYPGGVPCVEHMKLTTKLHTQLELHGRQLDEVARRMGTLEASNGDCARALGKMNGSIPRMEECLDNIFDRLRSNEVATAVLKDVRDDVRDQGRRLDGVEKISEVNKARQNMIWGVIASLFVGTVVTAIKLFIV